MEEKAKDYSVIYTNKGQEIKVPTELYDKLNQHIWTVNANNIVYRSLKKEDTGKTNKKYVSLAHEIFGVVPRTFRVWHNNRDFFDFTYDNIVLVPTWLHLKWTRQYNRAVSEGTVDNLVLTPWREAILEEQHGL